MSAVLAAVAMLEASGVTVVGLTVDEFNSVEVGTIVTGVEKVDPVGHGVGVEFVLFPPMLAFV